MRRLAIPNRNHKNGNGRRESDLARADDAARGAAEVTAMQDAGLESEIGALDAETLQEFIEIGRSIDRIGAQLADLEGRLASFQPSAKQ